jgi:diaminopropionate ammonia-lyase
MSQSPGSRSFQFSFNPLAERDGVYGDRQAAVLNAEGHAHAKAVISGWPDYAETPLRNLAGLAEASGVAGVYYKDESSRFGLGSFKPLGGAYAVSQCLITEIKNRIPGEQPNSDDLLSGKYTDIVAAITVTAATDGNHGRSVAWGARLFGCRCVIYINAAVTPGREAAIASYGAEVRRNPGTYDDAVRAAEQTATREGWFVIPDTSGAVDGPSIVAPRNVMQGYTLMAAEAIGQLPPQVSPTHTFLQAGVGGMAAAVVAQLWQNYGLDRPLTLLVEPNAAACWYESLLAGDPVMIGGDLESIMAGLACGEVSRLAWEILAPGADGMIKIGDDTAADCMRLLADGRFGDTAFAAGESAVAGLAGFLALVDDEGARERIGLGPDSHVLVFGTEGATDAETYREIVGRSASEIG